MKDKRFKSKDFGNTIKQNAAHSDGMHGEIPYTKHTRTQPKFEKQNVGYLGEYIHFTVTICVNWLSPIGKT